MISYFVMMTVVVIFFSEMGEKSTVNHIERLFKVLAVVMEIQSFNRYLLSTYCVPSTLLRNL